MAEYKPLTTNTEDPVIKKVMDKIFQELFVQMKDDAETVSCLTVLICRSIKALSCFVAMQELPDSAKQINMDNIDKLFTVVEEVLKTAKSKINCLFKYQIVHR